MVENTTDYFCEIHPETRVSHDAYSKGFLNCPKCGHELKPVESKETYTCWVCKRGVQAVRNRVEKRIDGVCVVCKAVYSIKYQANVR